MAAFISSMAIRMHIMPPVIGASKNTHVHYRRTHHHGATTRVYIPDATG